MNIGRVNRDIVTDGGYSIFMTTPETKSVRTTPESAVRSERTSGPVQVPVRTQAEVHLRLTSSDVPRQIKNE
jgi:hypothetical protein